MNKDLLKKIKDGYQDLSQFDFKQLDFREAGEWPKSVRIIFAVMFISTICAIGYFIQFKKMDQQLTNETRRENTLYTSVEKKIYEASHLEAYKKQITQMTEKFVDDTAKLPVEIEMSGLIKDISSSGLKYGLEFDKIVLVDERASSFYIELPIEITVRGTYHSFGQFLNDLTQLSRIITIHDFVVTPSQKNPDLLEMTVLVKTYKYNPAAQANLEKEENDKKAVKKVKGKTTKQKKEPKNKDK
jgi:type IV pilus assembly protein PilO